MTQFDHRQGRAVVSRRTRPGAIRVAGEEDLKDLLRAGCRAQMAP
jgi:hypothetical protein